MASSLASPPTPLTDRPDTAPSPTAESSISPRASAKTIRRCARRSPPALLQKLIEEAAKHSPDHALDTITWLPPIPAPEKIICIGVNYPDRNAEYKDGQDAPKYPSMFMRTPRSFVGHNTPLVRPRASAQLDYEGELVLVIGKAGRHIPKARRSITLPRSRCAMKAPSATGSGTRNSTSRRARISMPPAASGHGSSPTPMRIPDRRYQADDAGQWRDAAGRPHRPADLRLPLPDQLHFDLHDAGARRRHRHGNADRRRRAVRSAALSQARRRRRGRGRQYRRAAQWRDRRGPVTRSRAIGR